jgi:hypothetical protein
MIGMHVFGVKERIHELDVLAIVAPVAGPLRVHALAIHSGFSGHDHQNDWYARLGNNRHLNDWNANRTLQVL